MTGYEYIPVVCSDRTGDCGNRAGTHGGGCTVIQEEHDFSRGSIPRNILSLALPMTAAQLINVLYSVVDRIYLGQLPGHLALLWYCR